MNKNNQTAAVFREQHLSMLIVLVALVLFVLTGCQSKPPPKQPSTVPTSKNNITAVNPRTYSSAYKRFYTRAMEGDPVAQNNLGRMYADGRGVPQDQKEAVKWFSKASDQNNIDAEINLAMAYWYGRGVARDQKQACRLLKKSSEQGSVDALHVQQRHCNGS